MSAVARTSPAGRMQPGRIGPRRSSGLPSPPSTLEVLVPRDFAVRPPRGATVRRSRYLDSGSTSSGGPGSRPPRTPSWISRRWSGSTSSSHCWGGRSSGSGREGPPGAACRIGRRHSRRDLLREVIGDVAVARRAPWDALPARCGAGARSAARVSVTVRHRPPQRRGRRRLWQRVLVELDGELGHEGRAHGSATAAGTAAARPWVGSPPGLLAGTWACALALEVGDPPDPRWRGSPHRCRRRPCSIAARPQPGEFHPSQGDFSPPDARSGVTATPLNRGRRSGGHVDGVPRGTRAAAGSRERALVVGTRGTPSGGRRRGARVVPQQHRVASRRHLPLARQFAQHPRPALQLSTTRPWIVRSSSSAGDSGRAAWSGVVDRRDGLTGPRADRVGHDHGDIRQHDSQGHEVQRSQPSVNSASAQHDADAHRQQATA